jgi:hypothetical protein
MSMVIKQCFKCSAWGHTQAVCKEKAACGKCAKAHDTKVCKLADNARGSCHNCGGKHFAWQKQNCRTFQAYLQRIETLKANARTLTNRIRSGETPTRSTSPSIPQSENSQPTGLSQSSQASSQKRGRNPSTDSYASAPIEGERRGPGRPKKQPATQGEKRGPGRPRKRILSPSEEGQSRLIFSAGSQESTGGITLPPTPQEEDAITPSNE